MTFKKLQSLLSTTIRILWQYFILIVLLFRSEINIFHSVGRSFSLSSSSSLMSLQHCCCWTKTLLQQRLELFLALNGLSVYPTINLLNIIEAIHTAHYYQVVLSPSGLMLSYSFWNAFFVFFFAKKNNRRMEHHFEINWRKIFVFSTS